MVKRNFLVLVGQNPEPRYFLQRPFALVVRPAELVRELDVEEVNNCEELVGVEDVRARDRSRSGRPDLKIQQQFSPTSDRP